MKLGVLFATVASANQNDFYENGLSQIASNWKKLLDASEIKSTSRDRLNDRLDRIIAKLEDRDIKLRLVFKFISRILVMLLQNVFVIKKSLEYARFIIVCPIKLIGNDCLVIL